MSHVPPHIPPARARLVESILVLRHPLLPLVQQMRRQFNLPPDSFAAEIEQERAHLASRSEDDLLDLKRHLLAERERTERAAAAAKQEKQARAAAEKEAARFYNQPGAVADFDFWARLDYWTRPEAVALILGRNPKAVTPHAVEREIASTKVFLGPPMTAFLRDYQKLAEIVARAEPFQGKEKLRPLEVAFWAMTRSGFEPPAELLAALEPGPDPAPNGLQQPEHRPVLPTIVHTTAGKRRDVLSPVIEEAQKRCGKPFDVAAVWGTLQTMAEAKVPPLRGCTEQGLQYLKDGEAQFISRNALAKRIRRSHER